MHGQSIFDFFSPANSDEVRKQQIYKIVEQRFIPLNDMLGVYDNLDVFELTNKIFEQEKFQGNEYSKSAIKLIVNNASIDLLLKSNDELAVRGNIRTNSMANP